MDVEGPTIAKSKINRIDSKQLVPITGKVSAIRHVDLRKRAESDSVQSKADGDGLGRVKLCANKEDPR